MLMSRTPGRFGGVGSPRPPILPVRDPMPISGGPEPTGGGARSPLRMAQPMMFKKGGRVTKTGWAKVHKGETVIPAGAAAKVMGGKKPAAKSKSKTPKTKRAKAKIKKTMGEWKSGTLHSGSKKGPVVKSQKQAIAIALNQASKKK